MGGKHSKQESQIHAASFAQPTPSPQDTPAVKSGPALLQEDLPAANFLPVNILGTSTDDHKHLLLTENLGVAICRALGPEYVPDVSRSAEWVLLFNSNCHGKSFVRLVDHLCDRGPVVILIRDLETQRVFGGFNESSWQVVAAREREAKSAAAAAARAAREGIHDGGGVRKPPKQSRMYFGNAKSFLFSDTLANGDKAPSSDSVPIYRSREESAGGNSNYMYLFDAHPDDSKIGIGMGGQPGQFGWFLDRFLEKGFCTGPRCATYGSPLLVPMEEWSVDVVEAYAVHPRDVENLKAALATFAGEGTKSDGKSLLDKQKGKKKTSVMNRGAETNCDKMLLELNMQHQFRSEEQGSSDCSDNMGEHDWCSSRPE